MKKIKMMVVALVGAVMCMMVASCTSKEQDCINKITELANKVDEMETEEFDLQAITAEFSEIQKEAQECQFSDEERKVFAEQVGRFQGILIKQSAKKLPDMLKGLGGVTEGLLKGLTDELQKGNNIDK